MQLNAVENTSFSLPTSLCLPCGSDDKPCPLAAAAGLELSAVSLEDGRRKQQAVLDSFDLQGVAALIKAGTVQKIVVMAGAGISVSAGIPDFRSPGTGLYSQLQRFKLPWPEAVFDLCYLRHDPKPFCMLAKELWPGCHKHAPTPTHHFLRLLHDKGLLLSVFTQNIDGLEQMAGLPADKVVNAHGSFEGAHCIDCQRPCSAYAVQAAVYDDEVPICSDCGGLVKPDITFFGEALPTRFHRRRLTDLAQADLLVVLGTSLLVQPFAGMIDQVPDSTPRVLINLTRAGDHKQKQETAQHASQAHQQGGKKNRQHTLTASSLSSSSDASVDGACSDCSSRGSSDSGTYGSRSSSPCGPGSPALTACSSPSDTDRAGRNKIVHNGAASVESDATSNAESAAAGTTQGVDSTGGASVAATGVNDNGGGCSVRNGGFDFDAGNRVVLHLGDCDAAIQQLAALLGWQHELQELVAAGDAAFREAQSCWQE